MGRREHQHRERVARVALAQMAMAENPAANVDAATRLVRQAARQKADIVCLPELYRTRYFAQREDHAHFALAEPANGPSADHFQQLARELLLTIVVPIFERRGPGLYHNSAVVVDESGILGHYRKMHIPDDPLFFEKFYFAPGDLGFFSVPTRRARLGTQICWDQWFPEGSRLTALAGAEIIVYPTAIGWTLDEKGPVGDSYHAAWRTVQIAHAITNGCFVASVNRVGIEGELEFWGRSFIADPMGNILAEAGDQEELVLADCELDKVSSTRQAWPFLRDRRIDAYTNIDRRWMDA